MDNFDRILGMQIRAMNRHLAKEKKTLKALLAEERPGVKLRDGSVQHFKKDELEMLAEMLPKDMHRMLRLPIYIELGAARFGKGTSRVAGRAEVQVVADILGKESQEDQMFIYKPEIPTLRRRLPTTTQYVFTTTMD